MLSYGSQPEGRIVFLLAGSLSAGSTSAMTLVAEGEPRATIVAGPSDQAQEAAQELQHYLRRMSGAILPIQAEGAAAEGPRILVGQSQAVREMGLDLPTGITADLDEEGFVMVCRGDTLVLAGNETPPYAGTYFAVYEFLEQWGCRWFFPGDFGEVIPSWKTIQVAEMEVRRRPAMRIRHIWYSGHVTSNERQQQEFARWSRRNKLNNSLWQGPGDDTTYRLLPKDQYWDAHPEYYALRPDGSRNDRMPCMTEPGAIQAAADTICKAFAADPHMTSFAFSPPETDCLLHAWLSGSDPRWLRGGGMGRHQRRLVYLRRSGGGLSISAFSRPPHLFDGLLQSRAAAGRSGAISSQCGHPNRRHPGLWSPFLRHRLVPDALAFPPDHAPLVGKSSRHGDL